MIHIWQLPLLRDTSLNEVPELISSIVYNGLGFCKFSCDDSEGNIFFLLKKKRSKVLIIKD